MSRSLLRSTPLFRSCLTPSRIVRPSTSLGSSSQRFASTHQHEESNETYPEEGFNAPFYSKIAFIAVAAFVFSRISPSNNPSSSSVDTKPYLTRYIEYNLTPQAGRWKSNNENHLDLAVQSANDKLLFQEAEQPKVRRLRYTGTFDQASPNGIPVGSQADLSDLKIKSEKDDFAEAA